MYFPQINRVLIALPDPFTGELMQQYLLPSFSVHCFSDCPERLGSEIKEHMPDILIISGDWGNVSGVDVAKQLKREGYTGQVIIFAQQHRTKYLVDTINARLSGFLHSGCRLDELSICLNAVMKGNQYIASDIQAFSLAPQQPPPSFMELERLSRREREVLQLIAKHQTNSQIAEALFISPATVNNHRANIIDKLGLKGKYGLLAYVVSIQNVLNTEHVASF